MDTKPAKLFKVGGYLLDPTGRLDANMIRSKIAYGCGYPFVTHHLNVQQEKVREISEDHPLMDENCSLSDCEKYFHSCHLATEGRMVEVGQIYRHFTGKEVKILHIAEDTEAPGQYFVVFECEGQIWCKTYGLFLSKVDHNRYPDISQEYCFELVE